MLVLPFGQSLQPRLRHQAQADGAANCLQMHQCLTSMPTTQMALGQERIPDRTTGDYAIPASAVHLASSSKLDKTHEDATLLGSFKSSKFTHEIFQQHGSRHHSKAGNDLHWQPAGVQHSADLALQTGTANPDGAQVRPNEVQGRYRLQEVT
jgi:hypothetical protein